MSDINIETILEKVDQIPTISTLSLKINDIVSDPNSSAHDLADVIQIDIAISSKIMKVVNSAYYGFEKSIESLQHAVAILGFELVKNLTLSVACINTFKEHTKFGFDRNLFWLHSLGVAIASQMFAKDNFRFTPQDFQNFFTAGLMHDLGKVILECYFPEPFSQVLKLAQKKKFSYLEAEQKVMGDYNHQLIGKIVADKWKFPEFLVQTMFHHHNPQDAPEQYRNFVSVIHLANLAVEIAGIGSMGMDVPNPVGQDVLDHMSVTKEEIQKVTIQLLEKKSEIESMIGMLTATS